MPVLPQFSKFAKHSDYLLDPPQTNMRYLFVIIIWVSLPTYRLQNFVAIFHKYVSFFRLSSIFKQTRRSLPQADE